MKVISKVSILILLVLMALAPVCSKNSVPQFWLNLTSMSSFPADQEVYLGDRAKMKLGSVFIWLSKNSGPYLPHLKPGNNSCSELSFEQASVHDGAVFQNYVIICNREGKMYYLVPITS